MVMNSHRLTRTQHEYPKAHIPPARHGRYPEESSKSHYRSIMDGTDTYKQIWIEPEDVKH
jgi:hypothetical protein